MTKTPEEKAREYAERKCPHFKVDNEEAELHRVAYESYLDGYKEVTELREALKEIDRLFNSDCSGLSSGQWEDLQDKRQEALEKAKQLLKEE